MKPWLSIVEAALVMGKHVSQIYRWIDAGLLTVRLDEDGFKSVWSADLVKAEASVKRGRPRRAKHDTR